MGDISLFVKEGEELTAKLWDMLVKAARSTRILFGNGIRGRRTPDGTLLSCSLWSPWPHPFTVSVSGSSATISKGLLNKIEPTITSNGKKIPISGTTDAPQPTLDLSSPKFDSDGNGWILLEITADKTTLKATAVEVIQDSVFTITDQMKTRKAIAYLSKRSDGSFVMFQVAFFNLTHLVCKSSVGVVRHFVYPQ